MINFKEQFERDLKNVFFNTREFADLLQVIYPYPHGNCYTIPIVIDSYSNRTTDINTRNVGGLSGNVPGVFSCDVIAYLALCDIKTIPEPDQYIKIGYDNFRIVKSHAKMGQVTIELERYYG